MSKLVKRQPLIFSPQNVSYLGSNEIQLAFNKISLQRYLC